MDAGRSERIFVLDNDDPVNGRFDLDTFTVTIPPTKADSYRVHNDHLHYEADRDSSGTDRLTYRICNDDGHCASAQLLLHID